MSQAGILNLLSHPLPPEVPTQFTTDNGIAIPAGNNLNVLGNHGINTFADPNGSDNLKIAINNAITLGDLSVIAANSNAVTAQTGDIGITAGNLKLPNTNSAGSQGIIQFGGVRFVHNYGTNNTFVGAAAGNLTLTTGSAVSNTGLGISTLTSLTTGANNVAAGFGSALFLTTGSFNLAFGSAALSRLTTGSRNTALGNSSGLNYTGSENDNIVLGSPGTTGESNTIRIGINGSGTSQQNRAFMAGIYGVTPAGSAPASVIIDENGQLGTSGDLISKWIEVFASQSVSVGNGYVYNGVGAVVLTLPATMAFGDVIRFVNTSTGGCVVKPNSAQTLLGSADVATDPQVFRAAAYPSSAGPNTRRASLELLCVVANTTWKVISQTGTWEVA